MLIRCKLKLFELLKWAATFFSLWFDSRIINLLSRLRLVRVGFVDADFRSFGGRLVVRFWVVICIVVVFVV